MESYLRKRGVRLAVLVLLVLASLWFVYYLRDVFAPLILAFLIAYILNPAVVFLSRLRVGSLGFTRQGAVVLVFGTLFLSGFALVTTGGYFAGRWVQDVYEDLRGEPEFASSEQAQTQGITAVWEEQTEVWFEDRDADGKHFPGYIKLGLAKLREWSERSELAAAAREFLQEQSQRKESWLNPEKLREVARTWVERKLSGGVAGGESGGSHKVEPSGGVGLLAKLSWLILCPVYLFFILLRFDAIVASARAHLPGRYRPRIERIMGLIDGTISSFLRGRLLVCLSKGLLTGVGLYLLDVDNGFVLGLLSGFLSLIPYVGVACAAIPALIFCWLEHASIGRVSGVAGVFVGVEAIEGFVLVPLFLGKEIGLSPLTVLVTLFIFGKLLGFIGVLLSVPLAAICKILGQEFLLPLIRDFAREKPEPDPGGTR